MKKFGIIATVLFVFFAYILYEANKLNDKFSLSSPFSNSVITELPDISFKKLDGTDYNVKKAAKGSTRLFIHFWASWCVPCIKEFPELFSYIKRLENEKSFKFLLVSLDSDMKEIRKFLNTHAKDIDDDRILFLQDIAENHKNLGTYQLPETYIFDENFKLLQRLPGAQRWDEF